MHLVTLLHEVTPSKADVHLQYKSPTWKTFWHGSYIKDDNYVLSFHCVHAWFLSLTKHTTECLFWAWEGSLLPLIHLHWQDAKPKLRGAPCPLGATSKGGDFTAPLDICSNIWTWWETKYVSASLIGISPASNVSQTHFLHPTFQLAVRYMRIWMRCTSCTSEGLHTPQAQPSKHSSCWALQPTRTTKLLFQNGTGSFCHQQCLFCSYTVPLETEFNSYVTNLTFRKILERGRCAHGSMNPKIIYTKLKIYIAGEMPKKEENFTSLLKRPQRNNALCTFKKKQAFLVLRDLSNISSCWHSH